jgi:GABA(A) receptor-associated protein
MSFYNYANPPRINDLVYTSSREGSSSTVTVDLDSGSSDTEANHVIEVEKKVPFKTMLSYEKRQELYEKVADRHPNRVLVICEPSQSCHLNLDRIKFVCPKDIPLGHFLFTIRKRMPELKPSEAIFLLIGNISPCNSDKLGTLYDRHKEDDGFLYIKYTTENTFG